MVQVQRTPRSDLATRELGDYIRSRSDEGELQVDGNVVLQPRSFVIVGLLGQLTRPKSSADSNKVR